MKVSSLSFFTLAVLAMVVLLVSDTLVSEAATCSPLELSPCLPAITSSSSPTATCCSKLREQRPCLCGYIRNPNLKQYVSSPGAKRVASACGVPFPTC